jgi:hypothetical protein
VHLSVGILGGACLPMSSHSVVIKVLCFGKYPSAEQSAASQTTSKQDIEMEYWYVAIKKALGGY